MIADGLGKVYGNAVVAVNLRAQRSIPFLPREDLEARRDARIRRIVAHAARTVPHYREWFLREGIDPRQIAGADDLERLPVLDRELVRSRPDLFVADTRAARTALSFSTSGTTGTPLAVRHDRRSLLANIAFGERERQPVIEVCGGSFRPTELYVGYETSTFKKVISFYERNTVLPVRPARRFVSLTEPIEAVAALVNSEAPDVLVGYGGWIDLFFKTVVARGIDLHPPKMVMYMGEALPHGARAHIEEAFGIPILSRYNAVEAFKIGFSCEHASGFHIHEDLAHVRILGSDGATAAPGEAGEIVVSNLVNRASILLNYPIGDVAALSEGGCPCGRTFRLLSELEGRAEDVLPLIDGRFVHPRAIWQVFKQDREVLQYQLTQHDPERFELRLVTADEPAFARARDRALPSLRAMLGPGATIEASRGSELDRPANEKFRAVVSRCAPTDFA